LFGRGGDDVLQGLGGDDVLEGGDGADIAEGGEGHDRYVFLQLDPGDRIVDADGDGRIQVAFQTLGDGYVRPDGRFATANGAHVYELAGDVLRIDGLLEVHGYQDGELGITLFEAPGVGDMAGGFPITGGSAADNVVGSGSNDEIRLAAGIDIALGGGGHDWIVGNADADMLFGRDGDDTLYAEDESHALLQPTTAPGGDQLSGGAGADTLIGSAASDFLEGGADADRLIGGAGNDTIYGDGVLVERHLELMHDDTAASVEQQVRHSGGGLRAHGGQLTDGTPPATMAHLADVPGAGDDEIDAGPGNDSVYAGGGADIVYGGLGDDALNGAGGDDRLEGNDGNDRLWGGDGIDYLYGGAGFDVLRGGAGADVIDPGTDGDFIHALGGDVVILRPGNGFDSIIFEADPATVMIRVEGTDDVRTTANSVHLGADFASLAFLQAAPATPLGAAAAAGINIEFSDGRRTTFGELVARNVVPEEQARWLPPTGGPGSDTLPGNTTAQYLAGGAGNDTYTFRAGDGRDTIFDEAGTDEIVFTGVSSADVSVFATGHDMLLRYPGGEVRLVGQADAAFGVETVRFADGMWDRAALAARAEPLAPIGPLGVVEAAPGQPFNYQIAQEALGEPHLLGTARLELASMNGAPLPSWLGFDAATRTVSGTPGATDSGVVPLLVGLRDGADLVAAAPLVIALGAASAAAEEPVAPVPEQGTSPAEIVTPAHASDEGVIIDLPVIQAAARAETTTAGDVTIASFVAGVAITAPDAAPVGRIEDPVYERVESLLSAPATTHATSFVERYAEAIREFNERSRAADPSAPAAPPPPTDEEIGAYNEALQAWLDDDRRRIEAYGVDDGWDLGWSAGTLAAGAHRIGLSLQEDQGLARPGLPALRAIHATPGLAEGVKNLTL